MSIEDEKPMRLAWVVPLITFGVATLALGLGVETIEVYVSDAARVLANPDIYIDAVMPSK